MTTIILNPEAVNALFPEGTPARVELQRSVLQQLVKQYVKQPDLMTEVVKHIVAKAATVEETLKAMGVTRSGAWNATYKLSPGLEDQVRAQVREEIRTQVQDCAQTAIADIALQSRIDDYLNPIVKTKVAKAISDSLAGLGALAALAEKGA